MLILDKMSLMNKNIKKILIVRLSALGDIVHSAIVLEFIHQHYPTAKIEWLTEEVFSPLLQNHPLINAVHSVNIKKIKKEKSFTLLKETISKLHALGDYDIIIDMQGLIKSAIVARLIGQKTHGFDKNSTRESFAAFFYKTTSDINYETNVIKRNSFVVADALGFTINDTMILNKKAIFPVLKKFELQSNEKQIAFVIGASWKSKIYPKELVAKVIEGLAQKCFIIWASQEEKLNAEFICEQTQFAALAPKLTLTELVSFISSMNLVIGNDTGPTHIAWAQNIPSITLFGPTNTRMMYETDKNIAVQSSSEVDILKINKNDFSIKGIDYKKIVIRAKELLNGL